MHRRLTTVFLLALLFCGTPVYAYIDPGTGSALVYVVTGIVVSIYFAARGLYYRAKELLFRAKFESHRCNLALHSEDPRYETTFLPVLRALAERNVDLTYFTMYERSDSFEPLPPSVTHRSVPQGLVGYSYLNQLEAKMLVTTTPQLDVMTFRRSRKVKHYGHIPHALGESRFVRPFAYDFFDSVFCCGRLLEQNIRRIESLRKLPPKQLLRTGIPHYDELLRKRKESQAREGPPTVLIAPSWGPLSLFQVFGTDFVRRAAERFDLIVRPHPQMKASQSELYEEVLAIEGVAVDSRPTPADAMSRADVLVSDISGIIYEFAFIQEKPVIVIDQEVGIGGLEGYLLGDVVTLREQCREFIVGLRPADIDSLCDTIDAAMAPRAPGRIPEARKDLIYNWGHAGPTAACQIEQILACL
jgi:hypothetical protein